MLSGMSHVGIHWPRVMLQELKFIQEIGTRIGDATGEKRSHFFLHQAISMAVQRGNVSSILGTAQNVSKMDEIFYL